MVQTAFLFHSTFKVEMLQVFAQKTAETGQHLAVAVLLCRVYSPVAPVQFPAALSRQQLAVSAPSKMSMTPHMCASLLEAGSHLSTLHRKLRHLPQPSQYSAHVHGVPIGVSTGYGSTYTDTSVSLYANAFAHMQAHNRHTLAHTHICIYTEARGTLALPDLCTVMLSLL